jgi:hypothetical protein
MTKQKAPTPRAKKKASAVRQVEKKASAKAEKPQTDVERLECERIAAVHKGRA